MLTSYNRIRRVAKAWRIFLLLEPGLGYTRRDGSSVLMVSGDCT